MGKFVESDIKYIPRKTSDFLERSQIHGREILMTFIGAGIGDVCLAPKGSRWLLAPNVAKIDVDGIDESLEDSANLLAPEILAKEIVENLESALEQFTSIHDDLITK